MFVVQYFEQGGLDDSIGKPSWAQAVLAADAWLKHHRDTAVSIVDCRLPTSTSVDYRCVGFVPLQIEEIIAKHAAELRRDMFPEMHE